MVNGVECPSRKKKLLLQISKDYRHAVLNRDLPNKFCRLMPLTSRRRVRKMALLCLGASSI
jgi:hypothetical protein